jgi:alkylation response protein AidB-like acyl-CoA dehydrogenase
LTGFGTGVSQAQDGAVDGNGDEGFPEAVFARIEGYAADADQRASLAAETVDWLRKSGLLAWNVEASFGGKGRAARRLGELHYRLGRLCQSTRAIITAHQLVLEVLGRWASPAQKRRWLPQLASGEAIGAFALTERGAGSDPSELTSNGKRTDGGFVIDARKRWITNGGMADLVMVSVLLDGEPSAVLISTASAGVRVEPVPELLGFRAAMVADLVFEEVFVPDSAIVGPIGAGLSAMVGTGLDLGRFVTAWGSVGLIARLLSEARSMAQQNTGSGGFGNPSVKRLLAEMYVGLESSRALCDRATMLRSTADPGLVDAGVIAKYASVRAAVRAARNAVQIMGAAGCVNSAVAARFFRDAKILEIIEGPQELLETIIGGMWHDCFQQ